LIASTFNVFVIFILVLVVVGIVANYVLIIVVFRQI
jgi:hypothetical protein